MSFCDTVHNYSIHSNSYLHAKTHTSKHAGSDPHPIRIGSEALARSGPDHSCTMACFRTGSVGPKPDIVSQHPIGSVLVLHNMIRAVCGRMQPSPKAGNRQQVGCFLPETGPGDSCTVACFQARCVCPKPDQAIQIRSRSVMHNTLRAFFGKNRTKLGAGSQTQHIWSGLVLAAVSMTGRNPNASGSDSACFLGIYSKMHTSVCYCSRMMHSIPQGTPSLFTSSKENYAHNISN